MEYTLNTKQVRKLGLNPGEGEVVMVITTSYPPAKVDDERYPVYINQAGKEVKRITMAEAFKL